MEPLLDVCAHSLSSPSSTLVKSFAVPQDLRNCIFAELSLRDIASASQVCKAWYVLLQRDDFWRFYADTRLGVVSFFESSLILNAGRSELEAYYAWLAARRGIPMSSVVRRAKSAVRCLLQMAEVMMCAKVLCLQNFPRTFWDLWGAGWLAEREGLRFVLPLKFPFSMYQNTSNSLSTYTTTIWCLAMQMPPNAPTSFGCCTVTC